MGRKPIKLCTQHKINLIIDIYKKSIIILPCNNEISIVQKLIIPSRAPISGKIHHSRTGIDRFKVELPFGRVATSRMQIFGQCRGGGDGGGNSDSSGRRAAGGYFAFLRIPVSESLPKPEYNLN